MKVIKINESQRRRLFEAYQNGFSFEELSMIGNSAFADEDNSKPLYAYCVKWLGEPPFRGSSRAVFTLSDNLVLKLAYGSNYFAGIDQNKTEYNVFNSTRSPLLPRVLSKDDNFNWIVCENVVPATEEDFEMILGLPFYSTYYQHTKKQIDPDSKNKGDYMVGYDKYFDDLKPYDANEGYVNASNILAYIETNYVLNEPYVDKKYDEVIKGKRWFGDLINLVKETNMSDFYDIENFGIVNRDGKPKLVVLDSGLNIEVWKKHYRRQ